ncbi:hypothetical protein HKO22_08020 [Peptoniphilus sp. AGMB00490]|uniref:HpcH/HpaI aldolase/citrate lyase domain-containing protein n=1 Tax=Peptoniphilus faecalis TaxID=2731255 RepID=A0A848RFT2_9FIRM|nr:aldolase/citrate lyase family protein [Peptoniphilus faecalis]NMW85680.1 hypothetical protein [Peptoniphilus faecalis]
MTFYPVENKILKNLKKGEISIGLELYTGSEALVEILGYTGFDFYMLDMEHAPVSIENMRHLIRAADAANISTIVRVAENDYSLIARGVEEGAQGIIVPHISSAQDARKAIDSMRYPPEGKKGSCSSIRASSYSTSDWDDYLDYHSNNVMFIPLIEDIDGVNNAEYIFRELKPGLDAVLFGRGDLAQQLVKKGEKVNWDHPFVLEAYDKILELSKKYDIPTVAVSWPKVSIKTAREVLDSGSKILLYSIDEIMFYDQCKKIIKELK